MSREWWDEPTIWDKLWDYVTLASAVALGIGIFHIVGVLYHKLVG